MARQKKNGLSQKLLDQIRCLWALGYSYQQISERFDLTHERAQELIHGYLGRASQWRFSEKDFELMLKYYNEERLTYEQVAEKMSRGKKRSISANTVRYHIARLSGQAGIQIRRRGWSPKYDDLAKKVL